MKPLYTNDEYNSATANTLLCCECYVCNTPFFRKKYEIKKVIDNKKPNAIRFCSPQCVGKSSSTKESVTCVTCNKTFLRKKCLIKLKNFCSSKCCGNFFSEEKSKNIIAYNKTIREQNKINTFNSRLEIFLKGEIKSRNVLRKYLIHLHGNNCVNCKISAIWDNKPMVLDVDHIDGNASNNMPSNLRLLSPNCNSQTPTFCGKNAGKGRTSRGLSR